MEAATVERKVGGERPPVLRETPCECGELPMLDAKAEFYVCTNPACDGYGQICSAA